MIAPGATIGILGAGQLGRMLAAAAAELGYRVVVLDPDPHPPAAQLANQHIRAEFDDEAGLATLADLCDVISYEFENIPLASAVRLAASHPVHPAPQVLEVTQNRLAEKDFCNRHGVATTRYHAVDDQASLNAAIRDLGLPAVLKTRRMGYDGKGQWMLRRAEDAPADLGGLILEAFVPFRLEISVLVARGSDGGIASYRATENHHENHILATSRVPAAIPAALEEKAGAIARRLAEALDYVGVLAVEMFVTENGEIWVNELAPRVHNSGHWTIEAAVTSQFENHIRAICGLPLGATDSRGTILMRNLIGHDVDDIAAILADPHAHLHLYGKRVARPGRKMGHVTWVKD